MQVGVGVSGGCQAAVHAVLRFLDGIDEDQIFVKLDFANAFNCLQRDHMLETVGNIISEIYCFASRLTATIPSYSSAISHSRCVLGHNKRIHWPVC